MAKYDWELRSTGRPFGPSEGLDDDDFTLLSRHTTYSAAVKAESREYGDMKRACGQNAWSDHFAVFPLRNMAMQAGVECPICYTQHTIKYMWPANQRNPLAMERLADDVRDCPACRERRRDMNEHQRREDFYTHNPYERMGSEEEAN